MSKNYQNRQLRKIPMPCTVEITREEKPTVYFTIHRNQSTLRGKGQQPFYVIVERKRIYFAGHLRVKQVGKSLAEVLE